MRSCDLTPPAADAEPEREDPSKAADVETNLSKQAEEARTASAAIDAEEKRKAAEEARRASAAIDAEEKRKAADSEARKAEEARRASAAINSEAHDDANGDDSLVNEFMIMEEQQNTPGSVTETPKTSAMEQTPTRTTALTPDQKQTMKVKLENALLRKEVRS